MNKIVNYVNKIIKKYYYFFFILYILFQLNKSKFSGIMPQSIIKIKNKIPFLSIIKIPFYYGLIYYYNGDLLQSLFILVLLMSIKQLSKFVNNKIKPINNKNNFNDINEKVTVNHYRVRK